jgi:hypothetical protein
MQRSFWNIKEYGQMLRVGTWYRWNPWDNLNLTWELLRCEKILWNFIQHLFVLSLYANIDGFKLKKPNSVERKTRNWPMDYLRTEYFDQKVDGFMPIMNLQKQLVQFWICSGKLE